MPISYKDIRTKRQWKAATGVSEVEFHELAKLFQRAYDDFHGETLAGHSSGFADEAKFKSYEDILFFLLYGFKTGSTYDVLALNFNISRSEAFEQQAAQLRILQMAMQQNGHLPRKKFGSFEDLEKYLEGHDELLIDGTEQRRQRAGNQEVQKEDYSGKKKRTP